MQHMQWVIHSGNNTYFWYQNWCNLEMLCQVYTRFFAIARSPLIFVQEAWNATGSSWSPRFRRPPLNREAEAWQQLSMQLDSP